MAFPALPSLCASAQLLMSRSTERTINTEAIRTEGTTPSTGTSLGQLSLSILISSPSLLVCLVEPQSTEKPTQSQSAPSPSALHEGSTSDGSSFDTYRKSVAERVSTAERRRADAEDIIISVGPLHLFTHRRTHLTNRRPLCLQPLSLYSPEHPSQGSSQTRARHRRFISQEPPNCSPTPVGCRSTSLSCHPIRPSSRRRGRLSGSTHSGF